jgi:hypothetical protein
VFGGPAARCVNIVIEMPIAENSIRYREVNDRNYRRALKKRDMRNKSVTAGHYTRKWYCPRKNGMNVEPYHSEAGRIGSIEKFHDLIGSLTCDLPACSTVQKQIPTLIRKSAFTK